MSSLTPSQSASQILLPGSDLSADPVFEEPRGSFSINIPPPHSIDDHDAVHDNIPLSRPVVDDVKQKAESSDSDEGVKVELHKNKPFAHPPRTASPRPSVGSEKRYMLTRHPSTATTVKPSSVRRVSPQHQLNVRLQKPKPVSDLGPASTFKPGEAVGMPYARSATSSGSLLGTITGLFKGKRASVEYDAVYTGPTAVSFAKGWPTRADRNSVRSQSQLSSSEDLPSSVKRRSRAFGGEEPTPKPTHMKRTPDKGKGRAPLAIPSPTSATSYAPVMSLERTSSSSRSRETAANTALNSRTNGGGSFHNGEHPSVGRSESKRSATSSGTGSGRRREPQMGSSLYMGEVTRRSGGGRSIGSGGGGGLVLPPAKFEVVRAPPSVTQAPVLIGPSPSPLVLPSTRKTTSGPGSRGAPSPPPKHGTGNANASYPTAPTSPRRGAPYTKTTNGGSPRLPLKSALRVSSLSPSPSPVLAIHGSVGSSTASSSGTPTMPTSATNAIRLPEIHAPIPRPLPPTSMPSEVLPRPNRLSNIPASNRTSIVSENEYETCVEDFVDAEEGTESDTPPAAPSPPLPNTENPKPPPPEREHQVALPPQRTLANGSPPVDASVSSTSTQRKSVRVIIHPTVTVSAPEEYTEPPTPPAYDRGKEYEWYKSHSRSTSGSGMSHRSEASRNAVPSAWEVRVEHHRSVWDNSEPEDEDYRAAKSALHRASAL